MKIKKMICLLMALIIAVLSLSGCGKKSDNTVVIYASSEEFRNEYLLQRLKEQFPDYDIRLQYLPTGKNAAKIKAEGKSTEADILLGVECGYLHSLSDVLADVSYFDTSKYLDDVIDPNHKYLTWDRFSGAVVVNKKLLEEKGLPIPKTYEDLLKPEYEKLISMPNPTSSSTGYMFLHALCNLWGEDKAFSYFDKLSANIYQFTSSGSGPVNALVQGEAAIGLGMVFQSVQEINKGADLEILQMEGGYPNATTGTAVIDGRLEKKAVKDVFDFLMNTLCLEDKQRFCPEKIYKDQQTPMENYPSDMQYANMDGSLDSNVKEGLLAKWKY